MQSMSPMFGTFGHHCFKILQQYGSISAKPIVSNPAHSAAMVKPPIPVQISRHVNPRLCIKDIHAFRFFFWSVADYRIGDCAPRVSCTLIPLRLEYRRQCKLLKGEVWQSALAVDES